MAESFINFSVGEAAAEWTELMDQDIQLLQVGDASKAGRSINVGDAVLLEYVGRRAQDVHDGQGSIFVQHVDEPIMIVVGEKDVIPGLEMGVRFLQEGQIALIYSSSKFSYGPVKRLPSTSGTSTSIDCMAEVPPHSNVMYKVKILKVYDPDDASFHEPSFQIAIARHKKLLGNECFQYEWSQGHGKSRALMLYQKGAERMQQLLTTENNAIDDSLRAEARELLVTCLNNIAAVLLKAKDYGKAKEAATRVLSQDPDNLKALLRAARAALYDPAGTFEEATAALQVARQVDSSHADVKKLSHELDQRRMEYKKKRKAMFSKMGAAAVAAPSKKSSEKPDVMAATAKSKEPSIVETKIGEPEIDKEASWRKYLPYIFQLVFFILGCVVLTLTSNRLAEQVETVVEQVARESEL